MSLQRLILFLLITALVGISAYLTVTLMSTHREYQVQRSKLAETEMQLAQLRKDREEREAYLRAILNDPEFVERVVRERLGYIQAGEVLYRFDGFGEDRRTR